MHSDRRRRRLVLVALTAALAVAGCGTQATPDRQREVAERGAQVMPFDLERTTHTFAKSDAGGVQSVTADDATDSTQIRLIREHLRKESDAFARGDFSDPARIHGNDMPGLAELRAGHSKITVTYQELADGARITYTTADPKLVSALHRWFDAQVSDHSNHATHR